MSVNIGREIVPFVAPLWDIIAECFEPYEVPMYAQIAQCEKKLGPLVKYYIRDSASGAAAAGNVAVLGWLHVKAYPTVEWKNTPKLVLEAGHVAAARWLHEMGLLLSEIDEKNARTEGLQCAIRSKSIEMVDWVLKNRRQMPSLQDLAVVAEVNDMKIFALVEKFMEKTLDAKSGQVRNHDFKLITRWGAYHGNVELIERVLSWCSTPGNARHGMNTAGRTRTQLQLRQSLTD